MTKILTISGWGQRADTISKALNIESDYLEYINHQEDKLIDLVNNQYDTIIGWSQGGQIALKIAKAKNIKKIILIASPYEYLHETNAIPRALFQKIINDFTNNAKRFSAEFRQFICFGDTKFKSIAKQLEASNYKTEQLLYWLKKLPEIPNHNLAPDAEILFIHGNKDQVIPISQAKLFATRFKNVRLQFMEGAGHAPFLHDNQKFNRLVDDFRNS